MSRIVLVTGGARSGKSSFAESVYAGMENVVYIATARVEDGEMKDRVRLHQQSRPQQWITYEGTYDLYKAVAPSSHYLLDCVTVLTSNVMYDMTKQYERIPIDVQKEVENRVADEIEQLAEQVRKAGTDLVMVTNEVGDSIVPEHHVSRVYRDIVGRVNQRIAQLCSEVYLVTCGIPMRIK